MRRVLALLAITQAGCSALGLADFPIPECDSHDDCDGLNEAAGIGADECYRYVCIGQMPRVCTLAVRDLDNDDHPAAACASDPQCAGRSCDDCDDGQAAAFPGNPETCDGVDNDCDLLVDNVGAVEAPDASTLVSGTGRVEFVSYGGGLAESGVEPIAFGDTEAFFNVAGRDEPAAERIQLASANVNDASTMANTIVRGRCPETTMIRTRSYAEFPGGQPTSGAMCQLHSDCDDGVFCNGFEQCVHAYTGPAMLTNGCRSAIMAIEEACTDGEFCREETDQCEALADSGCTFEALAAAEALQHDGEARWFGVALETDPCGGAIRVGYFTETMGDMTLDPGRNLLQRGDLTRSASFRGIDLGAPPDQCTGASRGGAPLGAHAPSIAALSADPDSDRRRPQALAAWIGAPSGSGPVELLGLWNEQFGGAASTVEWVHATGGAIPERLPTEALGDVAPVVAPFVGATTAGYVVGYGSADGVVVRFVPAFGDPPDVGMVAPYLTTIEGDDERTSPPIGELGADVTFAARGGARSVDLAIGGADGDDASIGVAWADDDGVHFAIFELSGGTVTAPASDVRWGSATSDQVSIAFSESGLVLEGYMGAGPSDLGGWLVAWTDDTGTFGTRFSILDGARLAPDTMRLGAGLAHIDAYVARELDAEGNTRPVPRLAYHDASAMEFRALTSFCGPPM